MMGSQCSLAEARRPAFSTSGVGPEGVVRACAQEVRWYLIRGGSAESRVPEELG